MRNLIVCCIAVALMSSASLFAANVQANNDLITEIIQDKIEQLRSFKEVKFGDAAIASYDLMPELYERRGFKIAWTNYDAMAQLLEVVQDIAAEGLEPQDYHLRELTFYHRALQAFGEPDPWLLADFDILLTDSFIRLIYHLSFGKVDPITLHPGWNLSRPIHYRDPAREIEEIIVSGNIKSTIESLLPQNPVYSRLKSALTKYRKIQSRGGWKSIPSGNIMVKGDRDPRVAVLRQRLELTDGIPPENGDPEYFDETLEKAVKRFQTREELEPDGVVGRPTIRELNEPVTVPIAQIRANLERMRWFLHDLPDTYVMIDIAGFAVNYIQDGRLTWKARAQVGDPYTETPCFKANIKYVVLNPSWTVPPGIVKRELLPQLRKNPNHLKKVNLKVIDKKGITVNSDAIDWKKYTYRTLPYKFQQYPGPTNPLGRIKFICPNPFYVYLHDTPETEAFEETWRAFSHGCIRVEKPLELAELLLNNKSKMGLKQLEKIVALKKSRTIFLPRPVPAMFLYVTVLAEPDEMIYFRDDVYGRDEAVIKGLNEPFNSEVYLRNKK